jgi:hypothetical protein
MEDYDPEEELPVQPKKQTPKQEEPSFEMIDTCSKPINK